MASAKPQLVIDVDRGPALRTALDVLDLARQLVALLPATLPQRKELMTRADTLADMAIATLRAADGTKKKGAR